MTRKYKLKDTTAKPSGEADAVETYMAPPPPIGGRTVGLDCHPDTFTAAVFEGRTAHEARKVGARENMDLGALLEWADAELTAKDIVLMEAGSNSFEVCRRLGDLGLRACVLESCHVGRHAKTYADNDRMAAARIALVYLGGKAPCVWVPDERSRERRELLHAYRKAVSAHTAATNSLKGYLNGQAIRLGKRSLAQRSTCEWILRQRDWSPLQRELLSEFFADIDECRDRRKRLNRLVAAQVAEDPAMLRCMKALGVGIVSAFALMAVIGDIRRFHRPEQLVAYVGLNPGRLESGNGKRIRLGIGKRGRGDLRNLLVQGAQSVLRMGRHTALGQWGWRLFARKGNRNVAVAAVARKLLVQVWHLLAGNPPTALEGDKSLGIKLQKLAALLGKSLRAKLGLPAKLADCVPELRRRILAASAQVGGLRPEGVD